MHRHMPNVDRRKALVADGLCTVAAAARFLGLSRALIYVLISQGALDSVKIRGARRIPRRALVDLAVRNLGPREADDVGPADKCVRPHPHRKQVKCCGAEKRRSSGDVRKRKH
jgi:excisionase family DNA binding protein